MRLPSVRVLMQCFGGVYGHGQNLRRGRCSTPTGDNFDSLGVLRAFGGWRRGWGAGRVVWRVVGVCTPTSSPLHCREACVVISEFWVPSSFTFSRVDTMAVARDAISSFRLISLALVISNCSLADSSWA